MNQTIRVIFAVILVALSFTHPANAEEKLSFQDASINNDIKPEQFIFSDVIIKVKSYTKRITFSAKFEDISTPFKASNQQNSFNINIDADPKTGVIYAIRLAANAFAQTIPDHFSYAAKPNNFLIAPMSIQDGKFTSLYNQLTDHDKTMLKGACYYFKNDNNIQTLLSVKAPTGNSIVGQGSNKVDELLSKPNIAQQIKSIATLCFNATNGTSNADTSSFTKYKLCNFVQCVDQYSFRKPSFNGAIKPEQFSFSDVMIKARSNTDRVNIKVIFQDVSTPYKVSNKEETVDITFEGDPKSETVYALRLSYGTFSQTIPSTYSYEGKSSRFLIYPRSIQDGKFNSLYEQLTAHDKTKIKGVCNYFLDDNNIEEIISLKPSSSTKIIGKGFGSGVAGKEIGSGKGATRISKLLSNPDVPKQIRTLASLCTEATERVYVKDVQTFLNASGHNVGKNDGQWGKKSQSGWEAYLTSQGKPLDTAINAGSIQELVVAINKDLPKLRKINFRDGFFNTESVLKKHTKGTRSLCKYIDCELTLKEKLEARKTINLVVPWNDKKYGLKNVGLYWNASAKKDRKTIMLRNIDWNYHYGKSWEWKHPNKLKYLTDKDYHAKKWKNQKWGSAFALDIFNPNYQDLFAEVAADQIKSNEVDGIMLDWWGGSHVWKNEPKVSKARLEIAKKLRKSLGENAIILGNVNWRLDKITAPVINGVYLELYKKNGLNGSKRVYNSTELRKIENSISYHDLNLREPKLIAVDGRRKSKNTTDADRNSKSNRQQAKLLTAMSVVIPKNGYIIYVDNDHDDLTTEVRDHIEYDFYSFDIGKPTSGYNKVKSGVGYKEHDRGFIAYNITGSSKKFKRKNGQEHTIEAKSGLFCKDVGAKTECLSNN